MSEGEMFRVFTSFILFYAASSLYSPISSVSEAVLCMISIWQNIFVRAHFAAAPFCLEQSDIVSSRPPPQVSSCAKNGPFDSHVQITGRRTSTLTLWPVARTKTPLSGSAAPKKKGKVARRSARSPDSCWGKSVSCSRSSPRSFANGCRTINAALEPPQPRRTSQQFNYHLISCANDDVAAARAVANFTS